MTDTACLDCRHTHAGPQLAGICIGCPCETIPVVPPDPHHFVCMTGGCNRSRISSATHNTASEAETNARAAGWSIWSGTTRSGAPSFAVFCPLHNGHVAEDQDGEPVEDEWDAECDTCDSTASEEWSDEAPLTEADAEDWMSEHRCEPQVNLIRPTRKQAVA
jgi:hypothetical protein